ncbi:unnamed protein product [Chondrus crispus]|uniref:BZIP domain-containing protein n=1 Tax=Chondrus crispus TaxID=2769 RepID=R7QC61_CHOCR|nr:unnamed protein product [Chondrus crispus]CDF34986.1 unnamed protein product [Chondrus crispus]|eukprot:XP_005714805.1 unnamed protein product [Chondrus crispus]
MGVEEAEAEAEATAWDDGSGNMVAEVVPALAVTPDASFMQDYGMLQTANAAPLPFDEALGVEGAELLGPGPGPGPGLGTGTQAVSGVGVEVVQRGSDWSTSKSCSGKEWSTWSEAETSRAASSGGSAGAASGTAVKAELRKQRNRAAAARSNVKRKVRNETLRRDLAAASRRAAQLRAVEKVLREENVRLRSLANRHKLRVGAHLSHIQISRS